MNLIHSEELFLLFFMCLPYRAVFLSVFLAQNATLGCSSFCQAALVVTCRSAEQ